jgi:hypothetical protein
MDSRTTGDLAQFVEQDGELMLAVEGEKRTQEQLMEIIAALVAANPQVLDNIQLPQQPQLAEPVMQTPIGQPFGEFRSLEEAQRAAEFFSSPGMQSGRNLPR